MITAEVWNSVLQIAGERQLPGTGFVVTHDGVDFLITAKHLCGDDREEHVWLRQAWTNGGRQWALFLERAGDLNLPGDVAAFRLSSEDLPRATRPVSLTSEGMVLSQDCYLMGFPSVVTRIGEQALPLVKKAIVAGWGMTDEPVPVPCTYVDAIANPGFSGGPLVMRNGTNGFFQFAGVIKGYLTGPLHAPSNPNDVPQIGHTGLSVVTSATQVLNLLNS